MEETVGAQVTVVTVKETQYLVLPNAKIENQKKETVSCMKSCMAFLSLLIGLGGIVDLLFGDYWWYCFDGVVLTVIIIIISQLENRRLEYRLTLISYSCIKKFKVFGLVMSITMLIIAIYHISAGAIKGQGFLIYGEYTAAIIALLGSIWAFVLFMDCKKYRSRYESDLADNN